MNLSSANPVYSSYNHISEVQSILVNSTSAPNRVKIVQEKTVSYIFGEKVLRPFLDGSYQAVVRGFDLIKKGGAYVDLLTTKLLSPFPGADAAATATVKTDDSSSGLALQSQSNDVAKSIARSWVAVGLDPSSYGNFIKDLSPDGKLEILHDQAFQNNFVALQQMMRRLSLFVVEQSNKYQQFKTNLVDFCTSYQVLKDTLDYMIDDVAHHADRSEYSPLAPNHFSLTLPQFSVKEAQISQEGALYKNGQQIVALGSENAFEDDSWCSDNPIEVALLQQLAVEVAPLHGLNIESGGVKFTFEQFKKLFSSEVIGNLQKLANEWMDSVNKGVQSIELIVSANIVLNLEKEERSIRNKIHQLYLKHLKYVSESRGKSLSVVLTGSHRMQATGWEIKQPEKSYIENWLGFGNTPTLFSFSLESKVKTKKDEL